MGEIIAQDRPLIPQRTALTGDALAYQRHLLAHSAPMAEEVCARWLPQSGRLLDVGSGLGAYARAYLSMRRDAQVTLCDVADVLETAREVWAGAAIADDQRVALLPGDARVDAMGGGYNYVLAANLLHLYGPDEVRSLLQRARQELVDDGALVLVDLWVDESRSGPLASLYFSLNMALYTESGRLHAVEELMDWMGQVGFRDVQWELLPHFGETMVLCGRGGA
jgi:cyclopropane fatty-acyl-phospholipid synthase-like methyltransferase